MPLDAGENLSLGRFRSSRSQSGMGATAIVMDHELLKDRLQVTFANRNQVIQTLWTDGPDQPLAESTRSRCPHWSFEGADAQISRGTVHGRWEDRIAIVNDEFVRMVKRQEFSKLLSRPFGSRVARDIAVQNPSGVDFHCNKDVEHPECGGD